MEKSNNLAVLILAAGSSSRLGEPKQLLNYKGESLLKIIVKKALEISSNIFVVLGHEKEKCEEELKDFKDLNILYNEHYKKGMGTSISFGIENTKYFENTMILLVDQPFLPLIHLQVLKENIQNKSIVATSYGENQRPKVPAIFPKIYYEKLLKLDEDFGAKAILEKESCINIKLAKDFSMILTQ
jgi:molybdenum cofactor cytidylyltransferase